MKTFLFTTGHSHMRNMDVCVKAYRLKKNDPIYLGCSHEQTRGWKGGYAVACKIIADAGEAKMEADGYGLKAFGDTRVIEL